MEKLFRCSGWCSQNPNKKFMFNFDMNYTSIKPCFTIYLTYTASLKESVNNNIILCICLVTVNLFASIIRYCFLKCQRHCKCISRNKKQQPQPQSSKKEKDVSKYE